MNRMLSFLSLLVIAGLSSCRHIPVATPAQAGAGITQPHYASWQQVTNGMSEAQVRAVLGDPCSTVGSNRGSGFGYFWIYGTVVPSSARFPSPYEFVVFFTDGKVLQTDDPFDGALSADGLPTKPVLIYPQSKTVFSHYPRNVDLRWYPSSGEYPMEYKVEILTVSSNEETTVEPVLTTSVPGANEVRWRVKAINRRGESPWSEYRTFTFTR